MPTKKLTQDEYDLWAQMLPERCRHPDHDPPDVLEPGIYQHECTGCGRSTVFRVPLNLRHG